MKTNQRVTGGEIEIVRNRKLRATLTTVPMIHALMMGIPLLILSAMSAGATSRANTTSTPASRTATVTVIRKRDKRKDLL